MRLEGVLDTDETDFVVEPGTTGNGRGHQRCHRPRRRRRGALAAIQGLSDRLDDAREQLADAREAIEDKDDRIDAQDDRIDAIERDVERKDERIDRLETQIARLAGEGGQPAPGDD